MALPGDPPPQRTVVAGVKDQFPQQSGYVDHTAIPRQRFGETGFEVESSHGDIAGHCDRVRSPFGYPDRAMNRHNPCAVARRHRHHPARSEDQLIATMEVQGDHMAGRIIPGQSEDLRAAAGQAIENRGLSLFRH